MSKGDVTGAIAALREGLGATPDPAAHELLGGLLLFDDDLAGARRHLEVAFRQWKGARRPRAAALVAATLADLHTSWFGNRIAGRAWVTRARRLLEGEDPCVEQGYVELAVIACEAGEPGEVAHAASLALDLAREFDDIELEVRALSDSGYALVAQGRLDEGFARLDEAMAALSSGEVQSPAVACMSFCALLAACDRTGDVGRAEEWTRVIAAAVTDPFGGRPRALHMHCRLVYGSVLCTAGRLPEGEAALLEALGPEGSAIYAHRAEAAVRLASLRLLQGRVDEAAELVAPFEERPSSCEVMTRVHLLKGEPELANAVARRGLAGAGDDCLRLGALRAVLVEASLARDDVDSAAEHADSLDELATTTQCRLLRADAALAHARVAAARADPAGAIAHLERAAAELHADERPLLRAIVALELAEALAEAGDRGAAIDQCRAAITAFSRLGAAPLVDRSNAVLRSLGARARSVARSPADAVALLTDREQQVLRLLREGLTNAEIGERLFISAKTAEHHVGRVLSKLGVRSRAEAAAVATAASLTPS
jgi:DNA-binding CsgD family transcriptional regulator